MFPIREIHGISRDELQLSQSVLDLGCDEVSSSTDVFEDIDSFEENVDLDSLDPSLLCPDIILELGDTPIYLNNSNESFGSTFDESSDPLALDNQYDNAKFLQATTLVLSEEEKELQRKTYGSENQVQYTKIHCTACKVHLGSAVIEQVNRLVHPLLKVLVCSECYGFYTSGDFEKDEDGSEMYCRWCGQGGNVMCCSKCSFVFCSSCIRYNLGRKKLAEIKETDEWMCFGCDPSQLIELRVHCAEIIDYTNKELLRTATLANAQALRSIDYTTCCSKNEEAAAAAAEKKKKKRASPVDPTYVPYEELASTSRKGLMTIQVDTPTKIVSSGTATTVEKPKVEVASGKTISNATTAEKPKVEVKPKPVPAPKPALLPFRPSSGQNKNKTAYPYLAPLSLQQWQVLPAGQVLIAPPSIQENPIADLKKKHCEYEKIVRSALKANSALSYNLMQLGDEKVAGASLEQMIATHNKLQDVLNASIKSLMAVQEQLDGCRDGNPKKVQQPITNYFHRQMGHAVPDSKGKENAKVDEKKC